ncbi:uncharacterized protein LOC116851428 [Odontomachus brunneus]|uniref:uncharacterized protein LOC116851428 n=1 Tax=Odontomachus brunneus TaxID=486640 RepID=UPI0013F20CB7|nr:uncharacterized protein LOC116851428 [Odontomachus brunneus]
MSHTVHLRNLIVLSVALLFIHDIDADSSNRRILPTEVEVQEGQDFQAHFPKVLSDEATCYVRTPLLVNCNLKLPDSEKNATCDERIHYWSVNSACGFYVTNVQKEDNGMWRLTSQNDDERVIDVIIVNVLDKFNIELETKVELTKGMAYTFTFPDVEKYCIMQNPHDPSSIVVNNECSVEIEKVSATDTGTWNAIVGVRGQIEEVVKKINLSVFYEHVKSGYIISSDPEAIHIYCNYISMENRLNMCRFAVSSINQKGLRLREGMRKDRYEYYGNGLKMGECGLTIRSPKENDYGIWHCLLDVVDKPSITTVVEVLKPKSFQNHIKATTLARIFTVSPVITTKGEVIKLECSSNKPLSYCWFSQPNGKVYRTEPKLKESTTFSNMHEDETYWFGNCEILIKNATLKYNGTWTCHMGPASPGVELTEEIHVRIAETPLAAITKFISYVGPRIIFQCKTVPHAKTLTYCRFQSPTGFGIHVNELVNESNAIEQDNVRYWYSGESLAAGDCGLVVEPASLIHNGNWTCAANIEFLATNESFDTIYFSYNKPTSDVNTENDNTSATVSIVFGCLGFIIALAILIVLGIKYKKRFWNRSQSQNGDNSTQRQDDVSLNTVPTEVSIFSVQSISRNETSNRNSESSGSSGTDNNTGSSTSNNSPQLPQTHM